MGEMRAPPQVPQALALACSQQKNSLILGLVPARTQGEPRLMLIGRIGDKRWSAIFTIRDDKTRIISVRRSRTKEVERYED